MDSGSNNVATQTLILRIRKIALVVAVIVFYILGIFVALYFNLILGVVVTSPVVNTKYLVVSTRSGNNTVDIYQADGQVCVHAHSTSPADVPHQVCSEAIHKISRKDMTLRWFTWDGKLTEVNADYPNATSVRIVIKDGRTVIIDHSESFIEKLTDALDKGMNLLPEPQG